MTSKAVSAPANAPMAEAVFAGPLGSPIYPSARSAPLLPWQSYAFAVMVTFAVLGLRMALDTPLHGEPTLVVFTIPILLSAYFGGLRAGLLATALSYLTASYFLLAPIHSLRVDSAAGRWDLLFVMVSGVVICVLIEAFQRERRRADHAVQDFQQAYEQAHWLASFPAQNPNPIAEFDRETGGLKYANPAATAVIPGLPEAGLHHPWLTAIRNLADESWDEGSGRPVRCEVALGKTWHILTITCLPGTQRLRIYGSDITERKRAEEASRESEELFAKSFRLSPDCLVITRLADRTVVQVNEVLCQLWGCTAEQAAGRPVTDFSTWLSEGDRQQVLKRLAETGECLNYLAPLQLPSGRLLDFDVSSRLITLRSESCILSVMRDVTERRRYEEGVARLAAIVESSNDAIIGKDLTGTIHSWNGGAKKIFGYAADEIVGQPMSKLIPTERRHEEEHIIACLGRGESVRNFNTVRLRKDGRPVDVALTVSVIRDATGRVVGGSQTARDITEQIKADELLRESEAHFHLLDDLNEATRRMSDPAKIMPVMARLLGEYLRASRCAYADVAGDGEQFTILYDYTDGCASTVGTYQLSLFGARAATAMRAGQTLIVREVQVELPAGEGREMFTAIGIQAIICCPLVKEGRLRAMMAVHQEVPRDWKASEIEMVQDVIERCWATLERRIAEERLVQLNGQLEQRVSERTAQLEAANKELEAFSYSVSHDLRSPLRAVDGFSQALIEDYGPLLPEEGRRYLSTIRTGAQRMGALIDDLLSFSRLSRLPITKRWVDAERQVRETIEELKMGWDGREVDIRVTELPHYLGDPALVKQIWVNLLSNAVKYSRKRDAALVEVSAHQEGSEFIYAVRDNGTGFDMRYAHKLFGVFQRLHRTEDYEGTGVGLAIVQRIVHRHGGRVWAEAAVDQGATFYFTLSGKEEL